MKVLSVVGLSGRGKTTVIENLIKELIKRKYSVGTVKEIHYENFQIDTPGKNTFRHRMAGADTVVARAENETDILYKGKINIYDILSHFTEDIVIMEGVRDAVAPQIAVCGEEEEPEITPLTVAISGKFSNKNIDKYKDIPVVNCMDNIKELADTVENLPHLFYDFDKDCCGVCGYSCKGFLAEVLKGRQEISKCVLNNSLVELKINNREIPMAPFVRNILKNTVMGVVKELKGYKKNAKIEIKIDDYESY